MLRQSLLKVSNDARVRSVVTNAPVTPDLVKKFVAGRTSSEAVEVAVDLIDKGLLTIVDVLGEDSTDEAQCQAVTDDYLHLLDGLKTAGVTDRAEVSVKLSALGTGFGAEGLELAARNARAICEKADEVGSRVTIDMEDHTTTDATLDLVRGLRSAHPDTGLVLQAALRRTESDAREFAVAGSRVRLCKGAYARVPGVSFGSDHEIDLSYVRCLRILMEGEGYPMVATHDPRLIAITEKLAKNTERSVDSFEFQMLYGIRPVEQRRLVDVGFQSRVYLPYGTQWYEYFVRRVAEKPSTVALIGRSLLSRR